MAIPQEITTSSELMVHQIKELTELLGFETRNKYSVNTPDGKQVAYVAEQQKGVFGFFMRQTFGHWRTFELHVFDAQKNKIAHAVHPFRIFFQRLELTGAQNEPIGVVERRYGIFTKKFEILDRHGKSLFSVSSPIWKIWNFRLMRNGEELAVIQKVWSGFLKEAFTDADNFKLLFNSKTLTESEKLLIIIACVYIDLLYFEKKANQ